MIANPESAPRVLGRTVDEQTRCVHYSGPRDVIALKFKCCDEFYPCHACHDEAAEHPIERWSAGDAEERAVLCGACHHLLRIDEYLRVEGCPACGAGFNPGCALHYDIYFDLPPAALVT